MKIRELTLSVVILTFILSMPVAIFTDRYKSAIFCGLAALILAFSSQTVDGRDPEDPDEENNG